MSRTKFWCFTLNNYTNGEKDNVAEAVGRGDVVYLCYGEEVGENGTPHLQGYLEAGKRMRLSGVKKISGLERAHIEPRKGTQTQAIEYCSKDGAFSEYGTKSATRRGERSDLKTYFLCHYCGLTTIIE